MEEMVRVRSAKEYFNEYGLNGIGKGADKWMIRRQLIDAFQKEMFGLITIRMRKDIPEGVPAIGNPRAIEIIRNVTADTQKKWVKLCNMFAQYKETRDLLSIDDLNGEYIKDDDNTDGDQVTDEDEVRARNTDNNEGTTN